METEAEGQPAEKVSWGLLAGGLWHFSPEFMVSRVPVRQGTWGQFVPPQGQFPALTELLLSAGV